MDIGFLEKKRKSADMTQEEVGNALGMGKASYGKIENGVNNLMQCHFSKLEQIFNVTEQELIEFTQVVERAKERSKAELSKNSNVSAPDKFGMSVPIISLAAAASCNPGMMPLIDSVEEQSTESVWFMDAKHGDFVIKVTGTSMSPWYPEGTLLLVRPYEQINNGKRVIAVLDDGEIIFKTYAEKDGKIHLYSIDESGIDFHFNKSGNGVDGTKNNLRYLCKVIVSQRNEDDIDCEMEHAGIIHRWQKKLSEA